MTGLNLSRASTTATVDAVNAYLAKLLTERFTLLDVPAAPATPAPPNVPEKTGAAAFQAWCAADRRHTVSVEQNKIISVGRAHIEAMIASLNELKAAARANTNGAPGQDVNKRIKAACTVALVSVNKEKSNANRGELVSNMARHLAAFLPSKTEALRAAATLLAPTCAGGGGAASSAAAAAAPGSVTGAVTASAAAAGGTAAFAQTPLVGGGGAVDPRVPNKYDPAAVPTTALGAVAEYLPTAGWGFGLPTVGMAGTYLVSQAPCYLPAFLGAATECAAPGLGKFATAAAYGVAAATGRSVLGKLYQDDTLCVKSAAEWVGGKWVDWRSSAAAASAAASAKQILEAHVALVKAAQQIHDNIPKVLGEAGQFEVLGPEVQTFLGANRAVMERYTKAETIVKTLPADKQEANLDKALRVLVDFRVAEVRKLRARIAVMAKQKTEAEARLEAAARAELESVLRAPPTGAPNGLRQRPAAAAAAAAPPPIFVPSHIMAPPPPVRGLPRARTPARVAPLPSAAATSQPALAPPPANAAGGGGPALAASVVVADLSSLGNKPEYQVLAACLPEPQARRLLAKINELDWPVGKGRLATLEAVRAFIGTLGVSVNAREVGMARDRNAKAATAAIKEKGLNKPAKEGKEGKEGGRRTRRKRRTMRHRR
jgi:hypothetical protein